METQYLNLQAGHKKKHEKNTKQRDKEGQIRNDKETGKQKCCFISTKKKKSKILKSMRCK